MRGEEQCKAERAARAALLLRGSVRERYNLITHNDWPYISARIDGRRTRSHRSYQAVLEEVQAREKR